MAGGPVALIGFEVPVIDVVASVAVIVRLPRVFSVAEKVAVPFARSLSEIDYAWQEQEITFFWQRRSLFLPSPSFDASPRLISVKFPLTGSGFLYFI